MTLVEFLMARITEDEAWARRRPWWLWSMAPITTRILAEDAVKRRIVIDLAASSAASAIWRTSSSEALAKQANEVLHLLALPYAGHSDYRPEWRP